MGLFTKGVKEITDSVGNIIDNISTTDSEKADAKVQISQVVLNSLSALYNAQKDVIVAESNGNWLQRSWRPLLMITFAVLLVCRWFGLTASVSQEVELELMQILKFGIGGYVVGRSTEKVVEKIVQNIDIPFIKKKDRKNIYD